MIDILFVYALQTDAYRGFSTQGRYGGGVKGVLKNKSLRSDSTFLPPILPLEVERGGGVHTSSLSVLHCLLKYMHNVYENNFMSKENRNISRGWVKKNFSVKIYMKHKWKLYHCHILLWKRGSVLGKN